jgi:hypothetical protein
MRPRPTPPQRASSLNPLRDDRTIGYPVGQCAPLIEPRGARRGSGDLRGVDWGNPRSPNQFLTADPALSR